ncbi:hypothetical protein C8N40_10343 [Pontibacter mucosus]|uniref:Uncharacterized protein n=1 Tax=Pontibacter mucosus TaxID=1649266 RepID=A0A2T5YKX8_9BACT|nr:hypothetical protein [Pontibacter mucosus]PTX19971.1 hypothetical protein C8N40_10343 [Pontibacter mucosus]
MAEAFLFVEQSIINLAKRFQNNSVIVEAGASIAAGSASGYTFPLR